MPRILLIDDEEGITIALKALFELKGFDFLSAPTGKEGLSLAVKELPDLVLLDHFLPDVKGLEILKEIKSTQPEIAVIMITGYGEVKEAVEAMKLGAAHYFQKPIDLDELSLVIEKQLSFVHLKKEAALYRKFPYPIVGRSAQTRQVLRMISLMAGNSGTTVLITGETGTGKELVARNIHYSSQRSDKPFVDINCASIPETIFESELFGHEAGAFTDAKGTKKGLFELADGGSLFLDEVGEMPLSIQAKFLRVLETKSFRRVGGMRDIKVDVRLIAATNKDLARMVEKGGFREDLFYRLNVLPIRLAPLRERPEDIPMLAALFIDEISRSMNLRAPELSESALAALSCYRWPGNIRELRNVIERALILARKPVIGTEDLPLAAMGPEAEFDADAGPGQVTLEAVELAHIKRVLATAQQNRSNAARMLGISRSTLNEKIKKYNLLDSRN
jgi:two-component system response regulator AtoC